MERIKRFKDFNESQDATLTSTMSMRTPNAATGLDSSNPFTTQRLNQVDVIGDITKDAVGKVEEEDEENEDEEN